MIAEVGHYTLVLTLGLALFRRVIPYPAAPGARRYLMGWPAPPGRAVRSRRGFVPRARPCYVYVRLLGRRVSENSHRRSR